MAWRRALGKGPRVAPGAREATDALSLRTSHPHNPPPRPIPPPDAVFSSTTTMKVRALDADTNPSKWRDLCKKME